MAKDKETTRRIGLHIDGENVKQSVNSIRAEIRRLTKELNRAELSSKEYVDRLDDVGRLKGILAEHNAQLREAAEQTKNLSVWAKSWQWMKNNFVNLSFGVQNAWAGMNKIQDLMRGYVEDFAEMEEAESQVVKYTGMTKEEVRGLNDELKKADTRTARTELNRLAGEAGRLGITSKEGVLEFVDAADKINVALGEDLGEDAVNNIGKLAMMFGEDQRMGLRAAMLATGSAVNEVAQNSSAAEPFLVDFTARVAGAAHQAHIAQTDILGFASVMDENMLRNETSATAFQNIMLKMFTDTSKFAQIAGMDVQAFSDILQSDANEALLRFVEGLAKEGGLADLAPIFGDLQTEGQGVASVLSVMAGKVDDIRARQELANRAYRDGTSILNEFNVQNNTVQAGLDKAKNRLHEVSVELGEQLTPLYSRLVSLSGSAIGVLGTMAGFLSRHIGLILKLAAVVGSYYAAVKTATAWDNRHRAAILLKNAALKTGSLLMATYKAAVISSRIVFFALTGQIQKAAVAVRALSMAIKASPWGLLASLVTAAGVAVYTWTRRNNEATESMKAQQRIREKANGQLEDEIARIETLKARMDNERLSLDKRKEAIEELNRIIPGYNAGITKEGEIIQGNKKALDDYLKSFEKQILYKASEEEFTEYVKKERAALKDLNAAITEYRDAMRGKDKGADVVVGSPSAFGASFNVSAAERQRLKAEVQERRKAYNEVVAAKKQASEEMKKYDLSTGLSTGTNGNGNEGVKTEGGGAGGIGSGGTEKDKAVKAELERIEAGHLQRMAELKAQYLADDAMTEQDYAARAEALEMEKLQAQMKVAGLEPKQREEINHKILDYKMRLADELRGLDDALAADEEDDHAKELKKIEQRYRDELALLKKSLDMKLMTQEEYERKREAVEERRASDLEKAVSKSADKRLEQEERSWKKSLFELRKAKVREGWTDEEYNEKMRESRMAWLERMLQDKALSDEARAELQDERNELDLEQDERHLEERKAQIEQYKDMVTDIAGGMGEAMAQMFSGGEDAFKEALKQMLLTTVNAIHQYIVLAYIKTITDGILSGGVKLATGLAKIAAIEVAFAAVKGAINNFDSGGFTPSGRWDKPQGIVHSNEFVANRFAVANPHIRPVLDLIDHAQRTNSIGNLTGDDIAAVAGSSGFPTPASAARSRAALPATLPSVSDAVLLRTMAAINKLSRKLDEPIHAYTTATGRMGVNEAQRLAEKMNHNSRRKK